MQRQSSGVPICDYFSRNCASVLSCHLDEGRDLIQIWNLRHHSLKTASLLLHFSATDPRATSSCLQ